MDALGMLLNDAYGDSLFPSSDEQVRSRTNWRMELAELPNIFTSPHASFPPACTVRAGLAWPRSWQHREWAPPGERRRCWL